MKLRTLLSKAVLPALLVITAGTTNAAVVADLAADFVAANGAVYTGSVSVPADYSYLRSTAAFGGTENALTANVVVGNNQNRGFGSTGFNNIPGLLGNVVAGRGYFIFDAYKGAVVGTDLIVHPGGNVPFASGNPFVLVRYTLNAGDLSNGTVGNVSGNFRTDGGPTDVSVYQNGTLLYSNSGSGVRPFNVPFTGTVGDQITFVTGSGASFASDETSLAGIITLVPEPTTASLGLIGALALLRRRRA
ncbi:MAG: hypothetical protein H7Y43_11370 [Akkermansiaceae bacterium]|nr:hypothetical protein [Verrucomicrobiales bacterium]